VTTAQAQLAPESPVSSMLSAQSRARARFVISLFVGPRLSQLIKIDAGDGRDVRISKPYEGNSARGRVKSARPPNVINPFANLQPDASMTIRIGPRPQSYYRTQYVSVSLRGTQGVDDAYNRPKRFRAALRCSGPLG
jgi:hypothetical protein